MTSLPDDEGPRRQAVRQRLTESAEALRTTQASLPERIAALGFSGQAERALDLLPLVLVAWADGKVQKEERIEILQVLRMRKLEGTEAFTLVSALLEDKPSDAYMREALRVLREVLAKRSDGGAEVVDLCIDVAIAGRTMGSFDPISPVERKAIEAIAKKLGPAAHDEFRRRLDL